jgi:hypothetical protein
VRRWKNDRHFFAKLRKAFNVCDITHQVGQLDSEPPRCATQSLEPTAGSSCESPAAAPAAGPDLSVGTSTDGSEGSAEPFPGVTNGRPKVTDVAEPASDVCEGKAAQEGSEQAEGGPDDALPVAGRGRNDPVRTPGRALTGDRGSGSHTRGALRLFKVMPRTGPALV